MIGGYEGAIYGYCYMVEIEWSTDFDGRVIDPTQEEYARTLHGPFETRAEADQWMYDFPEDTDIADMRSIICNRVQPR